jgi:nucleoside-diphosphate-sugar epimerase
MNPRWKEKYMIQDEKILVTGVTGTAAAPVAEFLARNNEVWGLARFLEPTDPVRNEEELPRAGSAQLRPRSSIEGLGIRTVSADLASGDLSGVPDDFTYVLHFAYARVPPGPAQFEQAFRTNGDGTGFVLEHCRKAKAALVVSAGTVYSPHDDPYHPYVEQDPLGRAWAPWSPSSPVSKLVQEAVAGFCARAFDLPTTIVRLFMPYGMPGVPPARDVEAMQRGEEVFVTHDPHPQSPIHLDDICGQLEAMLGSAGSPALVVNWSGDEIVSTQDWCRLAGELLGIEPKFKVGRIPGSHVGFVADVTRRSSITGPCSVAFAEGWERMIRSQHA